MNRTSIVAEELLPPSAVQTPFAQFGNPSAMTISSGNDHWSHNPGSYNGSGNPAASNGYLEPSFTDQLNLSEFGDTFESMFAEDSDIGSMVSIGQSFSSFQSESASSPSQDDDILEAILRENGLLPPATSAPVISSSMPQQTQVSAPPHQQQQQYSQQHHAHYSQPMFDVTPSQYYNTALQQSAPVQQMPPQSLMNQVVPQPQPQQQQSQQQQMMGEYSAPIMTMQQHGPLMSSPPTHSLQSYSVGLMYNESNPYMTQSTLPSVNSTPSMYSSNGSSTNSNQASNNNHNTTSASDLLSSAISSHFSSTDLDSFADIRLDTGILKNILDAGDLTSAGNGDMLNYYDSSVALDTNTSTSNSVAGAVNGNGYALSTEYSSYGPTSYYQPVQQQQQTQSNISNVQTYPNSWSNTAPPPHNPHQQHPPSHHHHSHQQQQHKSSPLSQLLFNTPDSTPPLQQPPQSRQQHSPPTLVAPTDTNKAQQQPPPKKSALLALLESEMSPPSSPTRPLSPIHNSVTFNTSNSALSGLGASLNKKF